MNGRGVGDAYSTRGEDPIRRRKPAAVRQVRPGLARARPGGREEVVLHTGQHYDRELSEVFFDELGLAPPAYRLEAGSGSHAEQTARMLPGIEAAILDREPRGRARLRGHELDACRSSGCGQARRARGARRSRTALIRSDDARGAEPHDRRSDLGAALLSRASSPRVTSPRRRSPRECTWSAT